MKPDRFRTRRAAATVGTALILVTLGVTFQVFGVPESQPVPSAIRPVPSTLSTAPGDGGGATSLPSSTPLSGATWHGGDTGQILPRCDDDRQPSSPPPLPAVPPAPGDVSLRLVGQLGGGATDAAFGGDRVFVGAGSRVVELDVADATRPKEVRSSIALQGSVSALASTGDLVVAGVGEEGIVVLDRRDLDVIGSLALPGYAEDLEMVGSLAFVADGPGGLVIVHVGVPTDLRIIGRALDLHRITGVAVDGDRAFLAAADEGLVVLDVSDPSSPRSIGGLITGGYAFDVALGDGYAYLADGWGGLRSVDVGDAASPSVRATIATTAWTMGVTVAGGRALLAVGSEGLRIVDISDPARPADLGALPSPVGYATGVVSRGNLALVSDMGSGIRLVAIADPGKVTELATYTPVGTAQDIALVGDRAFIAARGQGLRVVDVSDPGQPREIQAIATQDLATGVAAVGSNVFFVTAPSLGSTATNSIFGADASSPGNLAPGEPATITGHVGQRTFAVEDAPGPGLGPVIGGPALQFAVSNSTMFVNLGAGVLLVDGATPAPCEAGFIQTSPDGLTSGTAGVAVSGEYAYLEVAGKGIYVVDVADPRDVRVVGQVKEVPFNGEGRGSMLLAAGSALYRASGGGISIYDLAQPQRPLLRGTLADVGNEGHGRPAAAVTHSLAYGGGHLFVADGARGLVVVDVSDPDAPRVAGRLRLPGDVVAVVVEGSHAYVASDAAGLFVVEWTDSRAGARSGIDAMREDSDRAPADREVLYGARRSQRDGDEVAAAPQRCLVSVAADAGPGTLRQCLEHAASGDTIGFDAGAFPSDRPATIRVESALPPIAVEGLTIEAIGAGVILDGGAGADVGLRVEGTRARISGVRVTGFNQVGILVDGNENVLSRVVVSGNEGVGIQVWGTGNSIVGSVIGANPSGMSLAGRQLVGVSLNGPGNVVGGPNADDRNIISGNRFELIIMQASANTIEGNFIRVDRTGATQLRAPDADTGAMTVAFSPGNRIVRNVIAGGIGLDDPGSSYNEFLGNHIGVDASGRRTIPCDPCGLVINLPYNRVGGTAPGEGNLINGEVAPGSSSIFLGNGIGVDVDGRPLKGGSARLYLARAGERNVVGGRAPGAANDIVGPEAILIEGSRANLVLGNRITSHGGGAGGVVLWSAGRNFVVANTISASDTGIQLDRDAYSNRIIGNTLRRNRLGVHASDSDANLITGNAFLDNDKGARDEGQGNLWDDGRRGNYWSDTTGSDADGDGIIDRRREITPAGIDRYPLATPP